MILLVRLVWWLLLILIVRFVVSLFYSAARSLVITGDPLDFLFGTYKVGLSNGYYLEEMAGFQPTLTLANYKDSSLARVYYDEGAGLKLVKYGYVGVVGIVDYQSVGDYYLLLSMRIFTCSDEILAVKFTSLSDYYVLDYERHRLYGFDDYRRYQQFLLKNNIKEKPLLVPKEYSTRVIDQQTARQECGDTPKDWHW